jgi:acyl transferase domain-containing protein
MNANHKQQPMCDGDGTGVEMEPIAIVGMAMRLPGGVSSGEDFWRLMTEKRSGLCDVPPDRYNVDGFYDSSGRPGTFQMNRGYFLQNINMQQFDTSFFPLSRTEVERLDPQQRQLLEVAFECMEDAGAVSWRGSNIGCYVGVFGGDWQDLSAKETLNRGGYRATSHEDFVLGNRVSYEFDLHGPRYV